MGFFSWLNKSSSSSRQLNCPRCLGKGHVDEADIIRLDQVGKWGTVSCAYCNSSGKIDKDMLSKVPVGASYLTNDLSESNIFGLGIFNANGSFQTFKTSEYSGWNSQGYLTQPQWGYTLALFANLRDEKSPDWIRHLTPNIKKDFLQSQQFIIANPELLFKME